MKLKFVLMLLIGMISFTALATTPVTDQNKKTEFVQHYDAMTYEVNVVEYTMPSITIEAKKFKGTNADFDQEVNKFINHVALVPVDVGWRNLTLKPNQQLAKSLVVPVDVGWNRSQLSINMQWPTQVYFYRLHYLYQIPIRRLC